MSKSRTPLARQLDQAQRWLQEGRAREARDLLAAVAERQPRRVEVITMQIAAAHALGERISPFCRRLMELAPDDDRPRQAYALEQMDRARMALALRELRKLRGPLHEKVQEAMGEIEELMPRRLRDSGLPEGDEGLRLLAQLDEADALREEGAFDAARAQLDEVLGVVPDSELALVRRLSLLWQHAPVEEVEAWLDTALQRCPQSGPLLVNRVRVLRLQDRDGEAREVVERLAAMPSGPAPTRLAQAVALVEVGEFGRVEVLLDGAPDEALPLLRQLAGVAALRLGKPHVARRHWQEAGRLREAVRNLQDLDAPAGEGGGPWLHAPGQVLPEALIRQVQAPTGPVPPGALRVLLQNAGPEGRRIAVACALARPEPEVSQVLAEYALSNLGPDASRLASAMVCVQRGALPAGPTRMWIGGLWQTVQLVRCSPRTAPRVEGPAKAIRLVEKADELNSQGRHEEAEAVAREALALKPDEPQLVVEVASCLYLQGHHLEAERMIAGLLDRRPPFPPAWILAALVELATGRVEAATERLDRLDDFPELSGGELCAYAQARMELALRARDLPGARSWAILGDWADPRAGLAASLPPS